MALIKSSPGQQWPGFSFALHLLRVQGFCFALLQYSPIQTFTAAFVSSMQLYHPRNKTAHRALQALFLLFAPFYRHRYQTGTSGYNTTCDTLERITAQQHIQRIPDTSRHAGRCTGQHRPPIIIRYIRVRPCYGSMPDSAADRRPCKPGGVSVSTCTGSARRLELWRQVSGQAGHSGTLYPAGQSSGRSAAGGAEPLAATAATLFGLSPDSQ